MRLAIVSPYITAGFDPAEFYNVQAFGLAEALVQAGVQVDIFTSRRYATTRGSGPSTARDGISVRYLGPSLAIPQVPMMTPMLLKLLTSRRYDIVQCSEDWQPTSMFIGGTKPLHDCRIAIYQGLYRVPSSAWGKMYFKMFNPFLLWVMTKQVDVVIAKTSAAEKFMKERGYTNVFRIPVGIDTRTFRPLDRHSARVALGFAPSDIILGFVGKLLPGRDPLQCLRVLSLLKPYIENVRLAVVGRGPLKTEMLRLASSEGLSRDVVMIDRIPNIGMPLFYSAIDVLLMPMSVDGIFTYGMAMLESLACGTPVVSMPIPAATDLIVSGRNGFVVDFGDADAMAMRASQLVMHEHSRGKISFQCRNVAKKLDWTNLAPHFLRVYDKC